MTTDLGHHLIGERLDVERRIPPRAAHVPGRRAAGLLEVEDVNQRVAHIAPQPRRMVERFVEDPHRVHVRIGRQVLVAEHQDLVPPQVLPQRVGGCLVDSVGEVDTDDLARNQGKSIVRLPT